MIVDNILFHGEEKPRKNDQYLMTQKRANLIRIRILSEIIFRMFMPNMFKDMSIYGLYIIKSNCNKN